MIDLTPLDVRNKRGDFKKAMRGYEPHEVDLFLEMVADRLETLVRENLQLRDRTETLQTQVTAQSDREQAVQDALVTAQTLRADIHAQSQREADHAIREAEVESRRMIAEADEVVRERLRGIERQLDQSTRSVEDLERRRARFLTEFRGLLEREMDVVHVEESRVPLEARAIDLDLGPGRSTGAAVAQPKSRDGAGTRDPGASVGTVPAVGPNAEAVSEESADAIIPAGVDPFLSSDLTASSDDLVPPGGVSGSIAAGAASAAGLDSDSASSQGEHTSEDEQTVHDSLTDDRRSPDEGIRHDPRTGTASEGRVDAPRHKGGRGGSEAPVAVEPGAGPDANIQSDLSVPLDVDALRPDMGSSMPEPEVFASEAEAYHEQRYGPRPDPKVIPVDVADLGPSTPDTHGAGRVSPQRSSAAPDPAADASALELELLAGATREGTRPKGDRDRFAGIPDLETVLAEAGVDDVPPPREEQEEIEPPPVSGDDPILLFDPDDDDRYRR